METESESHRAWRDFSFVEVLRDGEAIRIRAIRPDDKERLLEHFRHLSPEAVYFRFFTSRKRLTPAELDRFTEVDFVRHVALVATLDRDPEEKIIGVGRYVVGDGVRKPADHAEVAFAVLDEHQGRGIGTLLLEHLAAIARSRGIREFEADTLGENRKMLEVFAGSGFPIRKSVEEGVIHVSFPTTGFDRRSAPPGRRSP